jgi:hypothetical protein
VGRDPYGGYSLPGVWARGDIRGVIIGERNVGNYHDNPPSFYSPWQTGVFSYGSIDALISAPNAPGSATGGHVESVQAVGSIMGLITAADTIHYVRSGGATSASLVAPSVESSIQFDAALAAEPLPGRRPP